MKATLGIFLFFLILNQSNAQSRIELEYPTKNLCAFEASDLSFKLIGSFFPNEVFDLYYLRSDGKETKVGSNTKSPIAFQKIWENKFFVESSIQKIRSNIVHLQVDSPTIVGIFYNQRSACEGYSVPIRIDSIDSFGNSSFDKVQWLLNDKEIPNANKFTHNADKTGIYTVKAEKNGCMANGGGYKPSVRITIGEIEPPKIASNSFIYCPFSDVKLDVDTLGLKGLKYQWQLDGVDIANANTNKFTATKNGNYALKITQGKCEAASETSRIAFDELASPYIFAQSFVNKNGVVEICEGMELTMKENSRSKNPTINYQWQKNNIDILNATDFEYKTKEEGVFRLKITRGNCIAFSRSITVKFGKPKLIYLSAYLKNACEGDSIKINNIYSELLGSFTQKVKLYKNDKYFKDIDLGSTIYAKESGRYYAGANFSLPNSKATCLVVSDTIDVELKGKSIRYQLATNNSFGACADSILIDGRYRYDSTIKKYQWKYNGNILPNDTTYSLNIKKDGVYEVEYKNNIGCIYTSEPTQIVFNKLDIKITNLDRVFCSNTKNYIYADIRSAIQINDGDLLTYEWLLNGKVIGRKSTQEVLKSGTYYVKFNLKVGSCPTAIDSAKIEVLDIPKVITNDSLFICPNGYVNIEAPSADKFTWLMNNQSFANNDAQKIKASKVGEYKVWTEKSDCWGLSNGVRVAEKKTLPTATISGNKIISIGDSAQIKIDLTSSAPWIIKLTDSQEFSVEKTPFIFTVNPLKSTNYELSSVENSCGKGTFTGKAEINIIVLGEDEMAGTKLELFPIPTQNNCQLILETSMPQKVDIQLFGLDGKLISEICENKPSTYFKQIIALDMPSSGIYLLHITIGNKKIARKIIKQ